MEVEVQEHLTQLLAHPLLTQVEVAAADLMVYLLQELVELVAEVQVHHLVLLLLLEQPIQVEAEAEAEPTRIVQQVVQEL